MKNIGQDIQNSKFPRQCIDLDSTCGDRNTGCFPEAVIGISIGVFDDLNGYSWIHSTGGFLSRWSISKGGMEISRHMVR